MDTKTITFGLLITITGLLFSNSAISGLRIYNFADCESTADNNSTLVCPSINSRFSGIKSSWMGVIDNSSVGEYCARIVATSYFGASVSVKNGAEKCTGVAHKSRRTIFLKTGGLRTPRDATYYHVVTKKGNHRSPAGITLSGSQDSSLVVTYFVTEN